MKKLFKNFAQFYLCFSTLAIVLANIDFEYSKRQAKPLIGRIMTSYLPDGGTKTWSGLGYQITYFHKIRGDFAEPDGDLIFKVGPQLEPWPILDVPGIRKFLQRDATGERYYRSRDWSDPADRVIPHEEAPYWEMTFNAMMDLVSYIAFILAFWIFLKVKSKIWKSNTDKP